MSSGSQRIKSRNNEEGLPVESRGRSYKIGIFMRNFHSLIILHILNNRTFNNIQPNSYPKLYQVLTETIVHCPNQ